MAIALRFLVKKNGSGASSIQTDTGNTTVTGDTLVVGWADPNTTGSVSDNYGNTFTRVGSAQSGGVVKVNEFRCENATGGADHRITVSFSAGTADCGVYFGAISGAAAASFDKTAQAEDTATPYTVTTAALSQANELAVVIIGCDGAVSAYAESSGFTIQQQENNDSLYWTSAIATKITAATTALTPSFTVTGNPGAGQGLIIATFMEASGGGSSTTVTPTPAALTVNGLAPGNATTLNPAQAALSLAGKLPTTSAFNNVRIREVLVNGTGQAVGSATDIGLRVWYSGICAGAPDVSLNGLTTDANGTTSWSIATGTLAFNDPIFYVAQNSVSYSHYACGRLVPSYE